MATKDLHLFAMGNALVDIQLQISEADFHQLDLRKGGMALVEAQVQKALMDRFEHISAHKCSGGSAANTIIAFSQFGGNAGYGTILGDDHHGTLFSDEFSNLGIELFAPRNVGHTGTCLVLVTPDAERTLNTALAVNTNFSKDHLSEEAIKRAEWLYIEGYKFSEESGSEAIDHAVTYAKHHGTKIAVTFSDSFIVEYFGEGLRKVVDQADLIFCNDVEGKAFTGADTPEDAFAALHDRVPNVALTMGDKGSQVKFGNKVHQVEAFATQPIDTTGAGDMYAAGFLYGITHGYSGAEAGALGSYAASKVVAQLGARLINQDLQELRRHILGQ